MGGGQDAEPNRNDPLDASTDEQRYLTKITATSGSGLQQETTASHWDRRTVSPPRPHIGGYTRARPMTNAVLSDSNGPVHDRNHRCTSVGRTAASEPEGQPRHEDERLAITVDQDMP